MIPAWQVARPHDRASGDVLRPWGAQAHACDVGRCDASQLSQRMDGLSHPGCAILRTACGVRWLCVKRQRAAHVIDETGFDIRATQINARIERMMRLRNGEPVRTIVHDEKKLASPWGRVDGQGGCMNGQIAGCQEASSLVRDRPAVGRLQPWAWGPCRLS